MKPAAVDYARPRSLSEALELLARPNVNARVIAGGQSLVAMMNLRVASPALLVDIARLPDLGSVTEEDSTVFYLAVSEVCANAIEHAYSPAPAEFEVTATGSDEELCFVVRDEGAWRSPRGVNRGRGLNVVRAAMDEVEIKASDQGTEVVMRRRVRR